MKHNTDNLIFPNSIYDAYMLGLLWAEGNIYPKTHRISLEMATNDLSDILKDKMLFVNWNSYYRHRKVHWEPTTVLYIGNVRLCAKLVELDFISKLNATHLLQHIPKHLHSYWFRGYFDGDGCFYYNKSNYLRHFIVTAQYNYDWSFLIDLCYNLHITQYSIKQHISKKGHKCSRFRLTSKESIIKIGSFIYSEYNNIGLSRKYTDFLKIQES